MTRNLTNITKHNQGANTTAITALAALTTVDTFTGAQRERTEQVRAIKERDGRWRIDRAGMLGMIWEPLTSQSYSSAKHAMTALRAIVKMPLEV